MPGAAGPTPRARVPAASLVAVGRDLNRPECVLATAIGDLFVSDNRGGVTRIRADGRQESYLGRSLELSGVPVPNGIALDRDGSFLLAHLGEDAGGVFRLRRDGAVSPFLLEVDGLPLPPTNFVCLDRAGRAWVTVSTRLRPRDLDYRRDASSGFVAVSDRRGARIVADGLGYANECAVSPDGSWLYVVETFARRLSRFPLESSGDLGTRQTVAELGKGEFPDGMAFDSEGGVWLACILGNCLVRIGPDGRPEVWLDAGDPAWVDEVEMAYSTDAMVRSHMYSAGKSPYGSFSSVAFGQGDRRTAYIGSFAASSLMSVRLPFSGVEPVHWHRGGD